MRRLILMRHAKARRADPGLSDADRQLDARGREAAVTMGRWMQAEGYVPDHALVSTAVRTRETWNGVAQTITAASVAWTPTLYEAERGTILDLVRAAPEPGTLLVIGHQPGIGDCASRVLAEGVADAEFARYPTGAIAVVDFAVDAWAAVGWGQGRLAAFTLPRRLGARGVSARGSG